MTENDAIVAKWVRIIDFGIREVDDVPEKGQSFAAGVCDTLHDMRENIVDRDRVTEKQGKAILNMVGALCRWTKVEFREEDFEREETVSDG